MSFNLSQLHFNANENIGPGDIIRLVLSPKKNLTTLFLSLLINLTRLKISFDNTRLKVCYIDAFGALTEQESAKLPAAHVIRWLHPDDIDPQKVKTDADVIVIDCIDALTFLCVDDEERRRTEYQLVDLLNGLSKQGKIVFVGTTQTCRLQFPNKVKIYT